MSESTGLRAQNRQARRAAIVDAATSLFLERGVSATSITDIAERAGVSRRTFFLYFPSKEDVLFHHVEAHIARAVEAIDEVADDASAWDAVQAAMSAMVDAFTAGGVDDLAPLRAELFRRSRGLPGSLLQRLQGVHATVVAAALQRFPDSEPASLNAHVGACLGAAAAAGVTSDGVDRQAAIGSAIRAAGVGFQTDDGG